MYVGHSADQLRENLLNLFRRDRSIVSKVVEELVAFRSLARWESQGDEENTRAVLQDQPHQTLRDYHLIQARNMWMYKLSVMVYFPR